MAERSAPRSEADPSTAAERQAEPPGDLRERPEELDDIAVDGTAPGGPPGVDLPDTDIDLRELPEEPDLDGTGGNPVADGGGDGGASIVTAEESAPGSGIWTFEFSDGYSWMVVDNDDGTIDIFPEDDGNETIDFPKHFFFDEDGNPKIDDDLDITVDEDGIWVGEEGSAEYHLHKFDEKASEAWDLFKEDFGLGEGSFYDEFTEEAGNAWDLFKKDFLDDTGSDGAEGADDGGSQDDTDSGSNGGDDTEDATDDESDEETTDGSTDDEDGDDEATDESDDETTDEEQSDQEQTEEEPEEGQDQPDESVYGREEDYLAWLRKQKELYPELDDDPTTHDTDPNPIEDRFTHEGDLEVPEGKAPSNDGERPIDPEEQRRLVEEHMEHPAHRQDELINWGDEGAPDNPRYGEDPELPDDGGTPPNWAEGGEDPVVAEIAADVDDGWTDDDAGGEAEPVAAEPVVEPGVGDEAVDVG